MLPFTSVYVRCSDQEGSDVITFETLSPSWNEILHAWTLNFNGRVKIPSKKNFLVAPEKVIITTHSLLVFGALPSSSNRAPSTVSKGVGAAAKAPV